MTEQIITIYCFIDDFFHAIGRKDDVHCKVSDAKLLTTALLAARFFYGNLHSACGYMQAHLGEAHRQVRLRAPPAQPQSATCSRAGPTGASA